jgi:hypothetical protein
MSETSPSQQNFCFTNDNAHKYMLGGASLQLLCFQTPIALFLFKTTFRRVDFASGFGWNVLSWAQSILLVPSSGHQHERKVGYINQAQHKPSARVKTDIKNSSFYTVYKQDDVSNKEVWWIMSRNTIVVLIYHRHKLLDPIYVSLVKNQRFTGSEQHVLNMHCSVLFSTSFWCFITRVRLMVLS